MTRSGRTLRYIPGQTTRGNNSAFTGQYVIMKERTLLFDASHTKDFEASVFDGGLEANKVDVWRYECLLYSLNKKKRWLLPGMLAENIEDEEFHKDNDYKVVLVERDVPSYRGKRELKVDFASCTAVHQSKVEGTPCRRAKKGYSYETDLQRNPDKVRNRREERATRRRERARTGRRIPITAKRRDEEVPRRLPEIKYEVLRPRPIWPRMLSKTRRPWRDPEEIKREERSRKPCRKHLDISKVNLDTFEDVYLDEDEEWPLDIAQDREDLMKRHLEERVPTSLGCFITGDHPRRTGRKRKRDVPEGVSVQEKLENSGVGTMPARKRYGKGCAIHCPDLAPSNLKRAADSKLDLNDEESLDSGFESDGSSTSTDDHTVSWIDLGCMDQECVQPNRLRLDFGQDYVEGHSLPRRFSIRVKGVSVRDLPVSAKAVFAVDGVGHNSPMIQLRLRMCSADFPCQDLHQSIRGSLPSGSMNVVSVIEELEGILSCHASSKMPQNNAICKERLPIVTLDSVQSMMGWNFSYSTVEQVKAELEEEEAECEQHLHRETPESETSQEHDDCCGICFEDLAPSSGQVGMALRGCGHLFCLECWVHHVTNRVSMGESNVRCPAFKCETQLDDTTLLSILPDSLTHIHLTRRHDNRINGHPQWRWCPNPKCGRLVKVQEGKTRLDASVESSREGSRAVPESKVPVSGRVTGVSVPCECGVMWCSECDEAAHWPATCKQAAVHAEHVIETGVDEKSERIRYVEVKRCPSCRNPMEKNGGCMHMMCNCGFSFCWECLAAWEDHDWTSWDFKCPQAKEGLETVVLSQRRHQSVSFTALAVENRTMRRRDIVTSHRRNALKLAYRMFFVSESAYPHLYASNNDLLSSTTMASQDPITWSYSYDQTDQLRLISLVARATKMAAFTAEVRMILEYSSVLIGLVPRKVRSRRSGWKIMILRLMFITSRLEELLETQASRKPEVVWRRLQALLEQGQFCLKDITNTVPIIHKGLQQAKGQKSKAVAGAVTQE